MKNRFEKSADLLYRAFSEGKLDQNNCAACAVGNLLGHGFWSGSANGRFFTDNVIKKARVAKIKLFDSTKNSSDYSLEELAKIEHIFLDSFVGLRVEEEHEPKHQLNALMNVLEYLAELDKTEIPLPTKELFEGVVK